MNDMLNIIYDALVSNEYIYSMTYNEKMKSLR
ncbi:hypothetical protein SE1_01139, partial [Enterococcus hirae EnGen0127]